MEGVEGGRCRGERVGGEGVTLVAACVRSAEV